MTLQSAPFYWVTCDAPDCDERSPSLDDEYAAWIAEDQAVDYATDCEWLTHAGKHYCEVHRIAFDLAEDAEPAGVK